VANNDVVIRALAFDIFGTVVDWRGSIVREGAERWAPRGVETDWGALADTWRTRYQPSMAEVRQGRRPWTPLDTLHRESLDALLPSFGLQGLGEAEREELTMVWHRLAPWPDAVSGLRRLRARFDLVTLSNGNRSLLEDLVRFGELPFDRVLSAEDFQAYKPDPRVYRGAAERLGCAPGDLMLVAAHPDDLLAAAAEGLGTAYVTRPLEWGPGGSAPPADPSFAVVAADFEELARRLGS
jgi:2-haloacid dehalogenase